MLDFRGFDFFLRRPVLYSVLLLLGLVTTVVGGKIVHNDGIL